MQISTGTAMKLCIGMASGAYGRDADRSRARAIVGRENPPQVVSACAHERWARERASVRSLFVFTPIERLSMSVSADHAPSLLEGSAALSSHPRLHHEDGANLAPGGPLGLRIHRNLCGAGSGAGSARPHRLRLPPAMGERKLAREAIALAPESFDL